MKKFIGPRNKDIDSPAPGPKAGPDAQAKYSDYEVKDAFNTLTKAEEIKADPHLMKHVAKHADHHQKVISSIKELKEHRDSLNKKPKEENKERDDQEEMD